MISIGTLPSFPGRVLHFGVPGCACLVLILCLGPGRSFGQTNEVFTEGPLRATLTASERAGLRTYELSSNARLRDNRPPEGRITFAEVANHARIRTGSLIFDGLYALAVSEALQNSVSQIKDGAYGHGEPIQLEAFQTGEFWTYVWTRDLSYSTRLALAGFDPERAVNSLLFKSSILKPSVSGGLAHQMVQDTGSGGSYPVSSDRIVWILGASETLKYLPAPQQLGFLKKVYPILHDTLEQDRRVLFDPGDGLYRGEQSFLDWREQTYPGWTKTNVTAIAMSKALSVNAANYFALRTASEYAMRLHHPDEQTRYAAWAQELKTAINQHFFEPRTGLYSTYLLTDSAYPVRVQRYDLLGESLAILLGVADETQARAVLSRYPAGPFGPPVVWPEERTVPIYHNQAIWPFVTAYWIEAARKVNAAAVVNRGIHSLMRGAAFNLSNMENFDFASGKAEVKDGTLSGPVINSRRQLWSVAGYLAMVQDVVFGLETSWNGIRFLPFVTHQLRDETFASTNLLELQNFLYRGKRITVRIHLPLPRTGGQGACAIGRIELNGKTITRDFINADSLRERNEWDVYLAPPEAGRKNEVLPSIAGPSMRAGLFGPRQPEWESTGQHGITVEDDRLTLHYREADAGRITFNIYRDGKLCAQRIQQTHWTDPESSDYDTTAHFYTVAAVDEKSGNVSHLTPTRFFATPNNQWSILAKAMTNRGGTLADGRYFMDWGKRGDELRAPGFKAERSGRYLVRVEFSNGAGPVNTGITCAVKKLEIRDTDSGTVIAAGYLVMPQSEDWQRFDLSSAIRAKLKGGRSYSFRIFEDEYSRNMSYLAANERYTAFPGGGKEPYNFVNIASVQLVRLGK